MRRRLLVAVLAVAVAYPAAVAAGASPGLAVIAGIPQRGTVLGATSAPATLIVYEDLGCPHCRELMLDAFPTIVREYVRPGRLKVEFRGLGYVTPQSRPALLYALAAARQQRLWQVVTLYYENQSRLGKLVSDTSVRALTRGVKGLDSARLVRDARSKQVVALANAMDAEARRRDVPGTPWFLVKVGQGQAKIVQPAAFSPEAMRTMLDNALAP